MSVKRKYRAKIWVTLRPSILDPAGVAVQSGLKYLGYENVEQLRIGKYVELLINAKDDKMANQQLNDICNRMLANPVIENYRFEIIEVESQTGAF